MFDLDPKLQLRVQQASGVVIGIPTAAQITLETMRIRTGQTGTSASPFLLQGRLAQGASGGSAGKPLLEYEITIIGPAGKRREWTGFGQPKLEALHVLIYAHYPDTIASEYTLTWKHPNDVAESFEVVTAQWDTGGRLHENIKLELLSKGFADFSRAAGLEYLGLPPDYEVDEASSSEFPAADLPDGDIAEGQTETHHDLFQHFAKDLLMRRRALGSPEIRPSEQTRREIISPLLVLAVLLMPGMRLVAEEVVQGRLGHGPLDYAAQLG
ncbi:hypothetical protein WJX84_001466 [Apatococcus fuscideae]|uniref:Uncharacterized protein n=1 Tax=Apatococcus fuscideae TaxID=2026836 RepID=A0AAW1T574_9CHLO